jgi:hypothetical protein
MIFDLYLAMYGPETRGKKSTSRRSMRLVRRSRRKRFAGRRLENARYKHAARHLRECKSLASGTRDYGTFEPPTMPLSAACARCTAERPDFGRSGPIYREPDADLRRGSERGGSSRAIHAIDLACPRELFEPFQLIGPGRGCHKECKIGLEHFGGTILLDHPVS